MLKSSAMPGRTTTPTADQIRGQWHGQLARDWGLAGDVDDEHFQRLADGQHPLTGEQLVRHRTPCTYTNDRGQSVTTMAHRAGWDATFSAPKSVSLTALVGGDERVRRRASKRASVSRSTSSSDTCRLGWANHPAEATGQWVAAQFEHDSARPVDGYAAPQLHTHVVVFNLTRTETGEIRPLQPRELYKTPAVRDGGVSRGARDLVSRTSGYADRARRRAASPRSGLHGGLPGGVQPAPPADRSASRAAGTASRRGPPQIAAHQTREAKQTRHRTKSAAPAPRDGPGLRRPTGARRAGRMSAALPGASSGGAPHHGAGRRDLREGPQPRARRPSSTNARCCAMR